MTTTEVRRRSCAGWFSGRLPEDWFRARPRSRSTGRRSASSAGSPSPTSPRRVRRRTRRRPSPGRSSASARRPASSGSTSPARPSTASAARSPGASSAATARRCSPRCRVPVMTRLRQPERRVLDTLVDAGVARSRSEALAWCVRLVGQNADEWLAELRDALLHVERARAAGPQGRRGADLDARRAQVAGVGSEPPRDRGVGLAWTSVDRGPRSELPRPASRPPHSRKSETRGKQRGIVEPADQETPVGPDQRSNPVV